MLSIACNKFDFLNRVDNARIELYICGKLGLCMYTRSAGQISTHLDIRREKYQVYIDLKVFYAAELYSEHSSVFLRK